MPTLEYFKLFSTDGKSLLDLKDFGLFINKIANKALVFYSKYLLNWYLSQDIIHINLALISLVNIDVNYV